MDIGFRVTVTTVDIITNYYSSCYYDLVAIIVTENFSMILNTLWCCYILRSYSNEVLVGRHYVPVPEHVVAASINRTISSKKSENFC